jgi:hypothetical protein
MLRWPGRSWCGASKNGLIRNRPTTSRRPASQATKTLKGSASITASRDSLRARESRARDLGASAARARAVYPAGGGQVVKAASSQD